MNIETIVVVAVVAIVILLICLIASHKINVASVSAKFEGIANQLHMVHTTVTAPAATVAATIAANNAAAEVLRDPTPEPVKASAPVAAAPVAQVGGIDPLVAAMAGGTAGNATPGAPASTFDARTLISDSSVLDCTSTKFRTPNGVKPFTLAVEAGRTYMLQTSEGNAAIDVLVTSPTGDIIGHASNGNGYADVRFRAAFTGTATVVTTYSGTSTDAGITAHVTADTPDTGHMGALV